MHSLRHSFASGLIMAGEPPTRVANLLGHSSPAVTMRVYAPWFKDVMTEAINNLAKQLFSPQQNPKQAKSARLRWHSRGTWTLLGHWTLPNG